LFTLLRSKHVLQTAELDLLLGKDLKVLVDGGHREEDTRARPNGSHEVGKHGERANAETSERGGNGDVAVELLLEGGLTVTPDDELLLLELPGHIIHRGAGELDPHPGEEGAGAEDEDNVEDGVKGINEGLSEGAGGGQVVSQASDGVLVAGVGVVLPDAEELDEEVVGEAGVEHLGDHEDVGSEGGLENDGHVGGVEELDGVGTLNTAIALGLDWNVHPEALEVDDDPEDDDGSQEVGDIGEALTVEGLTEGADLVAPGGEEVEEGDDGSLELSATTGVNCRGAEGLPHDGLADVGGDEEGDSRSESVALAHDLVDEGDNDAGNEELFVFLLLFLKEKKKKKKREKKE